MPQERLTVRKIREALRLKWECQLSEQVIARSCRISHSTVGDYVQTSRNGRSEMTACFLQAKTSPVKQF
jgi:hypothetical protein